MTTGCWQALSRILGHASGTGRAGLLSLPLRASGSGVVLVWGGVWAGAPDQVPRTLSGGGADDSDCDHKGSLSLYTQHPFHILTAAFPRVATMIPIIWRKQWVLREAK